MKNFLFNIIDWFYEHPLLSLLLLALIYACIYWKYADMPASDVPAWVFMI